MPGGQVVRVNGRNACIHCPRYNFSPFLALHIDATELLRLGSIFNRRRGSQKKHENPMRRRRQPNASECASQRRGSSYITSQRGWPLAAHSFHKSRVPRGFREPPATNAASFILGVNMTPFRETLCFFVQKGFDLFQGTHKDDRKESSSEPKVYFGQCGWDGYSWGAQSRVYFRFSDSGR